MTHVKTSNSTSSAKSGNVERDLKTLQKYIVAAGIGPSIYKNLPTKGPERVSALMNAVAALGLRKLEDSKRIPTAKEIEAAKKKRDYEKELEGIDQSNIIDSDDAVLSRRRAPRVSNTRLNYSASVAKDNDSDSDSEDSDSDGEGSHSDSERSDSDGEGSALDTDGSESDDEHSESADESSDLNDEPPSPDMEDPVKIDDTKSSYMEKKRKKKKQDETELDYESNKRIKKKVKSSSAHQKIKTNQNKPKQIETN